MLPVILLTDFGASDPYVGQVRGALLKRHPGLTVIDLFHEIPPYAIASGAWLLERMRPMMPDPAVWVVVVDPGVGGARRGMVVEHQGSWFVGPDNGVLSAVLPGGRVWCLDETRFLRVARTFHGRDLFAPVAAGLALGEAPEVWGGAWDEPPPVALSDPGWVGRGEGEWVTRVMLVDRYGNLITALPGELVDVVGQVHGELAGRPCGVLQGVFSDVAEGACALVVGGFGTVEVVVNQGSAAQRFQAGVGAEVRIVCVSG